MSRASDHPCVHEYRDAYPARDPDLSNQKGEDELTLISAASGPIELSISPAEEVEFGTPPERRFDNGVNKYLWLVAADAVPLLLEEGPEGLATSRKRAAHTNLSGGVPAHCGGELWFRDANSFWLSGGSSRYQPRGPEELAAVVECFSKCGYNVASFGWEEEVAGPARFLRGEVEWS